MGVRGFFFLPIRTQAGAAGRGLRLALGGPPLGLRLGSRVDDGLYVVSHL